MHSCREYPGSDKVRGNLHVATKFAAYPWRVTPGNIVAACKGSLRRTGLEQISLGQLHWSAAKYAPLQVSEDVKLRLLHCGSLQG
jgi:pyridoxine 4-dehydrogenase